MIFIAIRRVPLSPGAEGIFQNFFGTFFGTSAKRERERKSERETRKKYLTPVKKRPPFNLF